MAVHNASRCNDGDTAQPRVNNTHCNIAHAVCQAHIAVIDFNKRIALHGDQARSLHIKAVTSPADPHHWQVAGFRPIAQNDIVRRNQADVATSGLHQACQRQVGQRCLRGFPRIDQNIACGGQRVLKRQTGIQHHDHHIAGDIQGTKVQFGRLKDHETATNRIGRIKRLHTGKYGRNAAANARCSGHCQCGRVAIDVETSSD